MGPYPLIDAPSPPQGRNGAIYNLLQDRNISVNGRFNYANFTLPPEDPRSEEVSEVQGSFIKGVSMLVRL